MKKILFISFSLSIVFSSCKEYKAIMSESTTNIQSTKLSFVDENKEIVSVNINGIKHNLLFDTGAATTIIYNPKFKISNDKIIKDQTIYGFDKKTSFSSYSYSVDSISSTIFNTKNKYLLLTQNKNSLCSSDKDRYDGLLNNFYTDENFLMELNYQDGYIQFINNSIPLTNYIELDSKFNSVNGEFYINMEINGVKDYFLFDTGNRTMTLLNSKKFTDLGKKYYTINLITKSVMTIFKNNIDIYSAKVKIGDELEFEFPVGTNAASDKSILNKKFIEKFNWIIDLKKKKVYCKPIDREKLLIAKDLSKKNDIILSGEFESKLLVAFINFQTSNFNVGDEIISVNNQKVTPENICEMQDLLNRIKDWNSLNIEVIPAKK